MFCFFIKNVGLNHVKNERKTPHFSLRAAGRWGLLAAYA